MKLFCFVTTIGRVNRCLAAVILITLTSTIARAGSTDQTASTTTATTTTTASDAAKTTALANWWHGKYASGNWFGLRDQLEDHGIKLTGMWKGFFYGIVNGGLAQHGAFDEEVKFMADVDFARLLHVDALEGLTATAKVRWRDGRNPNTYVGAFGAFGPSDIQSGQQWRFNYVYLTYVTPELFGIKNFLTLSGGWQDPYDFFLDVPLENLFVNNTFSGTRGLANLPWSSSYGAWGGFMKIKPNDWWYAMNGLYMAIPQATALGNHGLYFQGYGPDPSQNGLMYIGETGFTPKIGPSKLPGKYAFGGYWFGAEKTSFNGTIDPGQYGFYWQADQMLFRQHSAEVIEPKNKDGKSTVDNKTVEIAPKYSEQGLYAFSMLSYAPGYNNLVPFYFTTGLVYKGLIPTREHDQIMFAFAYGQYSIDNINNLETNGASSEPNYSSVLEWDYRFQINKFAYVQPFCQYIIQPNGTNNIPNATVLGMAMGVTF
ncbi:MAG: carbohydrate porin [Chthoniobacterales bacterium]